MPPPDSEVSGVDISEVHAEKEKVNFEGGEGENVGHIALQKEDIDNKPFELYKRRTTIVVRRELFLDVICDALSEYKYVGANQRADLVLACRYSILSPENV